MAFNAKNLHYEKQMPAFLQRLQGQYTGDERNSAAQQRMQQRPKKLKSGEDEDDAPTYVDEESGEVVGKEEYERLVRGEDEADLEVEKEDEGVTEKLGKLKDGDETGGEKGKKGEKRGEEKSLEQNVAEIGAVKKRKVGKIVGGDEEGDDETKAATPAHASERRDIKGLEEKAAEPKRTSTKGKSGRKKIKLSFDED